MRISDWSSDVCAADLGLLLAQQVAGTADVEVVAGELEAGTEAVQRLHHVQALLRRRAEDTPRRQREVGIAALLGTADAAAELVKLRQAEHVGTVDHHGVGGRDVEADRKSTRLNSSH